MSLTAENDYYGKSEGNRKDQAIPLCSKLWVTADGDTTFGFRNLGFIAQHASAAAVDVNMRLRGDDSADVVTVNVNQEYSGDVAEITASGTTATKIVIRI